MEPEDLCNLVHANDGAVQIKQNARTTRVVKRKESECGTSCSIHFRKCHVILTSKP